ncbi:hypothetical protein [Burkholderia ubonensis]|uniref:hypothetical protein n=1 Tax=Burkholderia ubonensis TaxID=101571 RepID=UPI0012F966EB|nr:hypothetical protein [Burkholderia ubonensis]
MSVPFFTSFQGSTIQLHLAQRTEQNGDGTLRAPLKEIPGDWDTVCFITGGSIKREWSATYFWLTYLNSDSLMSDSWAVVTFKGWLPKDILLGAYSQYNVRSADTYIGTEITPEICAKKQVGNINISKSFMFLTN